jgi:hypothetical protein
MTITRQPASPPRFGSIRWLRRAAAPAGVALAAALGGLALPAAPATAAEEITFNLVRTRGLPTTCAPRATARAHLETKGFAEELTITVRGFRPGTPLVLFALQVPNAPFGIGWYLSDLQVGATGSVTKRITTRLNNETFAVAVGAAPAPKPHGNRDGGTNPVFKPVHTFHLGVWFDSVQAGAANGCRGGPTPFNGDHTAGVQVLNTGTFPDNFGPLRRID